MILRDGRRIDYLEVGDPTGFPVMHHHGGLSSNLDVVPAGAAARAAGLRIVAPNRPGVAGSARAPGRLTRDWAADAAELADQLELRTFAVLGWSLGGAFAQAVAVDLGPRVTALALVASVIPPTWADMTTELNRLDRIFMALHDRGAKVDRALLRGVRRMARRSPATLARLSHFPPAVADQLTVAVTEGLRQAAGVVDEYRCMATAWGFEPSDIAVPTAVWQGDADDLVPTRWGTRLARAIEGAELHTVPAGTHFLAYDHWDAILAGLVPTG